MNIIDIVSFKTFCSRLQGQEFSTIGGRAKFILESVQDRGFTYLPKSTGISRYQGVSWVERILNQFALTNSFNPSEYDFTRNASYVLALIKRFQEK